MYALPLAEGVRSSWKQTDLAYRRTLRRVAMATHPHFFQGKSRTTLEATQVQISSRFSTDATSGRWHLNGSWLKKPSICPWVVSRVVYNTHLLQMKWTPSLWACRVTSRTSFQRRHDVGACTTRFLSIANLRVVGGLRGE